MTQSNAENDCKVILSLMGKEPYLAKGHVEDGEYKWTIIADKISVTEMLRSAALAVREEPASSEAASVTSSWPQQASATASDNPSVAEYFSIIVQALNNIYVEQGKRLDEIKRRLPEEVR